MPNYCSNNVTINTYKDKKTFKHLTEVLDNYDKYDCFNDLCNALLKKSKKDTKDYEYNHYGTKWWDFSFSYEEDGSIYINGDSAWGPPLRLIQELSAKYNLFITGDYYEPGMGFAGEYEYTNGEEWHQECSSMYYDYKNDFDYFFENYIYYYLETGELNDYETFEDFLNQFDIDFKDFEIEEIRNFYYENCNKLDMELKENILKELDDVNNHLKNLSMEGLSKKIESIHKKLKTAWELEEKQNETKN